MNAREYVTEQVRPLLPVSWAWIGEQRVPDTLGTATVIVKHSRITRLSEAPIGHLENTVTLSIFDPRSDIGPAENALDDHVVDMLTALDGHQRIRFEDATKVLHPNQQNLGWDIRLTVITQKD